MRTFGCLGVLLLAIGAAGCPSPPPPTPVGPPPNLTLANFEKIREGMTLQEVEGILGPPGARATVEVKRPDGSVVKEVRSASWIWVRVVVGQEGPQPGGETRRIVVNLQDGKVSSKEQVGLE